ncbi:MAG: CcmD family protein [Dehalococcoidia bacterium]|nr:CcmD family protein [Dehalococcoidia bacterium]
MESGENLWYLFAAYSIIWLAVFGYVFVLIRREKAIRRDIAILKEKQGQPDSEFDR